METLNGKIVLVTGGAQGLGKAICETLSAAGAKVIVADVNNEQAESTAARISARGGQAECLWLDVSDEGSIREAVAYVEEKFGTLSVLINNAGVDYTKSVDDMGIDEFDRVLAVNLRGPFVTSKLFSPLLTREGCGQIINITSTAAKRAWANAAAYHASKWGLLGLSHALHVEGREKNVKVTALVAGGMKTPFILDRFPEAEPNLQDPQNVAETVKFILTLPPETVIPEIMVLPMKETSWP